MSEEVLCRPRFDVHRTITETILSAIGACSKEFVMPWHQGGSSFWQPRPINALTGRHYRGINTLALWAQSMLRGLEFGYWATYRQWRELDAHVRRGEQGSVIVFYKEIDAEPDAGDEETTADPKRRLIARASWVFNCAQVEGWRPPGLERENPVEAMDRVERFIKATGADIRERGHQAFYHRVGDYIQVPPRVAFTGTNTCTPTEAFYATVFHELTHWTGHSSRLDRDLSGRFGGKAYAMEELVAELGAAFLCADLEVTNLPRQDHAQYIGEWYTLLTFDKKAVFFAASRASAAATYLAQRVIERL